MGLVEERSSAKTISLKDLIVGNPPCEICAYEYAFWLSPRTLWFLPRGGGDGQAGRSTMMLYNVRHTMVTGEWDNKLELLVVE